MEIPIPRKTIFILRPGPEAVKFMVPSPDLNLTLLTVSKKPLGRLRVSEMRAPLAARRETAGVQNRQPSVQYVLDPVLEHKRKIV